MYSSTSVFTLPVGPFQLRLRSACGRLTVVTNVTSSGRRSASRCSSES